MPLHNLFKIMEFDMKESTLCNTSWQVQYFSLFMDSGAGKKIEMSEGFFLRSIFYVFFSSDCKTQCRRAEKLEGKEVYPLYSACLFCVYGCATGSTEGEHIRQTDKEIT